VFDFNQAQFHAFPLDPLSDASYYNTVSQGGQVFWVYQKSNITLTFL
jgi:hypothetical protein